MQAINLSAKTPIRRVERIRNEIQKKGQRILNVKNQGCRVEKSALWLHGEGEGTLLAKTSAGFQDAQIYLLAV